MNKPTQPPNSVTSKTFTIFPHLPEEIRLLIWEYALPGSRIVEIRQRPLKKTAKDWEAENEPESLRDAFRKLRPHYAFYDIDFPFWRRGLLFGIESTCPAPALLFVSHEARRIALKRYKPVFECLESMPQTYFDFDTDILYIRWDQYDGVDGKGWGLDYVVELLDGMHPILDLENLKQVKRLAILDDTSTFGVRRRGLMVPTYLCLEQIVAPVLRAFGGVEELILVTKHYSDSNPKKMGVYDPDFYLLDDSIDVEKTMAAYLSYHQEPLEDKPIPPSCPFPGPELSQDRLQMELLALERSEGNWGSSKGKCPTPSIEKKVVLEPNWKNNFENAETSCRLAVEMNRAICKEIRKIDDARGGKVIPFI